MTTPDCNCSRRTCDSVCEAIRRAGITCAVAYDSPAGVVIDWNGDVVEYQSVADALSAVAEIADLPIA